MMKKEETKKKKKVEKASLKWEKMTQFGHGFSLVGTFWTYHVTDFFGDLQELRTIPVHEAAGIIEIEDGEFTMD